jgi:hypothetical protein
MLGVRAVVAIVGVLAVAALGLGGIVTAQPTARLAASQASTASRGVLAGSQATGLGSAGQAAAASSSCADVLFLGARGSGQQGPGSPKWPATKTPANPNGLGLQVQNVYAQLAADLSGARPVLIVVNYPADSVPSGAKNPAAFFDGVAQGVSQAETDLIREAKACPHQQIVLSGYSQGAMIMHRLLRDLPGLPGGQAILARVAAVVLVADGDQVPYDNDVTRFGTAPMSAQGIGLADRTVSGSSTAKLPDRVGAKVLSVCNNHDPVCASTDTNLVCLIDEASSWCKQLLAIHTGYTGTRPLLDAANEAAGFVLRLPLPTPVTVTLTATLGTPFSHQLTADVGAGYTLQWELASAAVMPPGLTLSATGLISGTPAASGATTTTLIRVRSVILGVPGSWVPATIQLTVSASSAASWTATEAPLPANAGPTVVGGTGLNSVACPSASECIAAGGYDDSSAKLQGLLLTESGPTWIPAESPLPAGAAADPDVYLGSVACMSASSCVAVGYYTDSSGESQELVVTGSGTTWTATKVPVPGGAADLGTYLYSVACPSASECVAVGGYEDSSGNYHGLLLTGFGTTWTATDAPLPTDASAYPDGVLNSVACPSASSCVAVGHYDSSSQQQGLLLTGSGTTWTATEAPTPADAGGSPSVFLDSVACSSASSCVAAGGYEDSAEADQGLLVTGSGTTWIPAEAPLPAGAAADHNVSLSSVACLPASSCVAIGYYIDSAETNQGLLVTGSGATWTPTEAPAPSAYTAVGLVSAACSSASSCVVGGSYDNSVGLPGLLLTGSGTQWTPTEAPLPSGGGSAYLGVSLDSAACPSANSCIVVGRYQDAAGNWQALLLTGPA